MFPYCATVNFSVNAIAVNDLYNTYVAVYITCCIEAYEEFLLYAVITEEARGDLG